MEDDELEMTKEELQQWIREKIKTIRLISPAGVKKCHHLQSLLERREKQAARLLKLCESVAACEELVKKQYSLLGWEYRDGDSDGDDLPGSGNRLSFPSDPGHSGTHTLSCPSIGGAGQNRGRNNVCQNLTRQPVVVLTRLEIDKIGAPASQSKHSTDETSSNAEQDADWKPDEGSDSDSFSFISVKRKKRMKTSARKTATQQTNTRAKGQAAKTSSRLSRTKTTGNKGTEACQSSENTTDIMPFCISTICQSVDDVSKVRPNVPDCPLKVNMKVLARRKQPMIWHPGIIREIVTMEGGRIRYKVHFDDNGKRIVSGHHVAFDTVVEKMHVYVGARVVARYPNTWVFSPGILAEIPTRSNRDRFLVFFDNHTPAYLGSLSIRLVCRPLADPLDDIQNEMHKNFMRRYIEVWPHPPCIDVNVGETLNAELDGVQQQCKVLYIDQNLIKVLFTESQKKEFLHRGSYRLEYMREILKDFQ